MVRLTRVLPLLLLLACLPQEDAAPPAIRRVGDLTVESRDLRSEAAFAAVGLAGEGDKRTGSSSWDGSLAEGERRSERDGIRRGFRLTIANRGATAREFHARIDYRGDKGALVARRSLETLVVPPFSETSWSGAVLLPHGGNPQVVARILPASEPFDPLPQ